MASTEYPNTKVYNKQGGDNLVVASGGEINVESSGKIELQSGSNMKFFSTDITGDSIGNVILSQQTVTQYISDTVSVFAVSIFSPGYGYTFFSVAAGCSKCSIKLPSARLGATLVIDVRNMESNAAASIFAASAGGNASLNGIAGTDLSTLAVAASNAEGWIKLVCATEGLWSVVDNYGGIITEQASA